MFSVRAVIAIVIVTAAAVTLWGTLYHRVDTMSDRIVSVDGRLARIETALGIPTPHLGEHIPAMFAEP